MDGATLIAVERQRQIDEEGWSSEHDDSHDGHDLALAAACYAAPDTIYMGDASEFEIRLEEAWPWPAEEDKRDRDVRAWYPDPLSVQLRQDPNLREKRIRELVKAGALIAAEIDRLRRLNSG